MITILNELRVKKEKLRMRRLIAFFTILHGIAQWSMLNAQSSMANGQRSMDLDEVQVTAHRRLVDTGVQKTVLDTAILHQNVALSMSDILTQAQA